jgi:hypothetical protein
MTGTAVCPRESRRGYAKLMGVVEKLCTSGAVTNDRAVLCLPTTELVLLCLDQ